MMLNKIIKKVKSKLGIYRKRFYIRFYSKNDEKKL